MDEAEAWDKYYEAIDKSDWLGLNNLFEEVEDEIASKLKSEMSDEQYAAFSTWKIDQEEEA